ncbi:MAG: PD-(D/E)XK nuclease family protein [Flavobacteriaceae bacterium]
MQTFLEETLSKIKSANEDLSSLIFILPSKRACGFLLNFIKQENKQTSFAPKIISIEEFIEELSGLQIIDNTELLFKSYSIYLNTSPDQEKDSFEVYSTWANTLLNDFNEIDRYLIDPKSFFNYLSSIQDINHWYVKDQKTELVENYLKFWNSLNQFYSALKIDLLKNNLGYQGVVYREAAENMEHYKSKHGDISHIFIGFNALNNAEQTIIQELLETGNTTVYWDIDSYFYNDKNHSTSYFIRKYVSEWFNFQDTTPEFIAENFKNEKNITIVETQKNIGQVKFIAENISKLSNESLNNTAIVLADENLLHPLLQSLPSTIKNVNITMGVALKTFPLVVFFELLLTLHLSSNKTFYYKPFLAILNHPIISKLLIDTDSIVNHISKENLTHITLSKLTESINNEDQEVLNLLFSDWEDESSNALISCKKIVIKLKSSKNLNSIEKVVIFELHKAFNKIENLNKEFKYLKSIKTVHSLFSDFIATSTIDFKGDAYNGLQIMGVLESRVLDFENVIIASVNEGVFPSGKSNNSFITYDLKQEYKLPTYTEKDAIYTYHFYRLLHRAKNIMLLYNNFSDGLSTGEKSRFISQLEFENLENHTIKKVLVSPEIKVSPTELKTVKKTEAILDRIEDIAKKGFSPSALTSYMRNPIDFYYQKILGIKDKEEVEETVAFNTLGTIVHDTLEAFYKPLEGSLLSIETLGEMKLLIPSELNKQFIKTFKGGDYSKGRNLIIFEVAKRFVENFINFEIKELEKGNEIKILQIESNLRVNIPISEIDFPINIHGKVDRVDQYNGVLRIIDYKTGKVEQSHLNIANWEDVTTDYKYSKIIQVLAYAYMIHSSSPINFGEAGIISFKNLKPGFLKFTKKKSNTDRSGVSLITNEIFDDYLVQLKKLIVEICNPEIPFTEKEV